MICLLKSKVVFKVFVSHAVSLWVALLMQGSLYSSLAETDIYNALPAKQHDRK